MTKINTTTYSAVAANTVNGAVLDAAAILEWREDVKNVVDANSPEGMYGADGGGTDAYSISLSPAPTTYFTGMVVRFKAGVANTGAATLNVNGLGAKTIKKNTNDDLQDNDIVVNQVVEVVYDGTNFQMLSTVGRDVSVRAYHNTSQSIASATETALAFNSERYDTLGMHDPTTNNSRLTCKQAGKYRITGQVNYASNATGIREVSIKLNGTTFLARSTVNAVNGSATNVVVSTTYNLAFNDYVELLVYQNSGGALNVASVGNISPEFMMERVG